MAAQVWILTAVALVSGVVAGEPLVKSALGTITGKTETYDGVEVESFLGIPYAKPPLGDLRFALPQALKTIGELNATQYSPACIQTKLFPAPPIPESEDCLYLNIFRKEGTRPDSKKPVLLLIHGGAFCLGAASHGPYNSLPIVSTGDLIVVSINYRLGILGFADMKGLAPGNLGLLDQLSAVEWVHENIAAFGGDPDRVTLIGVSAGSMSVSALVNTPLVRGKNLFNQAVMDAGVMSRTIMMSQDLSLKRVKETAVKVGCATEGEEMLSCLRTVNATELTDASFDPDFSPIFTFAPTVDGVFIQVDPSKDTQENSHKFADVRMIVGVAKDEGSLFAGMYPLDSIRTEDDFVAIGKNVSRGFLYPLALENETVRDALVQTYFGKSANHHEDVAEFIADGSFTCPTNAFVKSYAKSHKRVFVYNFEKVTNRKYEKFGADKAGAYHGLPFTLMYGTYLATPEGELGGPLDPEDKQFILDLMGMLIDFAKHETGLKFRGVTWPNYSNGEGILIINDQPTVREVLPHQDRCQKVFPFLESA